MKNDLAVSLGRSKQKPVLSWMSQGHQDERWQWVSDRVDRDDTCHEPPATLAATHFDQQMGWIRFQRRYFCHTFGVPAQIAFFSPHNAFSTSELLTEVPADPFMNSLRYNGQLTCENIRLHSHGWDAYTPCANYTWETHHEARTMKFKLNGDTLPEDREVDPYTVDEQKERSDSLLDPWENRLTPLDDEVLDAPVPTGIFWTALFPKDASPWDVGRRVGHRFMKGNKRMMTTFERQTGVDLVRRELVERARNAGLDSDRHFEDSRANLQSREREFLQHSER